MLRFVTFLLGLVWLASHCPADDKKVPLQTDFPREVLAGTPPNVLMMLFPGLEAPADKPPELMVPEGTTNLARGKKVTSSETDPVLGAIDFVTDGVKEGTEETFVELSPGVQWVQIDLGAPACIHAVYVWHFFREARSYHDVIVQVADDEAFTQNVKTLFNNDTDASSKKGVGKERPYIETHLGKLIDAGGVTARYVRLSSKGNTANSLNHYVEVEVFGTPAS